MAETLKQIKFPDGRIANIDATTVQGYTPLNSNLKGAANGVAELDSNGKVPSSQLPSYVDDVLEYNSLSNFPATGQTGKIYIAKDTNKTYRWGGSSYTEISSSLALGTTSSTAYRGDYGDAAYKHGITNKGSAFSSGLYKITTNSQGHVTGATAVQKSDITGLGIPAQDTTYTDGTKDINVAQVTLKYGHMLYTGTGTAGQAGSSSVAYKPTLWTFNTSKTPTEGDIITIKIPVAGVNTGIWMSIDNGTTYVPVAMHNKTRLTTNYGVDNIITLVYQSNMATTIYGTDTSGAAAGASAADYTSDRWCVINGYDSNSTYSNASLGQGYATCSTAEATAAKVASLSSYSLQTGGIIAVKFTYAVPANATLNINSKGAKAIYYKGAKITAGVLKAGDIGVFIYSSYYHLIAIDRISGLSSLSAASGGTAESLVTTGQKYTWNNKASTATATTSVAGLMSAADKTKLNGIAEGATANVGTITGITMNGSSKGTSGVVNLGTVITAHQDISGKADKSATVSTISYDTTNKKITKTINGTTTDVVSASTLKTDMSLSKSDVGLGNVENKSSATIRGELTSSNVTTALGYTPLNASLKGANSGVAELDSTGKVPSSQLPSYVDDVLEYSEKASFPTTGETGKIYVDQSDNKTYRWSGTAYVQISPSLALGTTSSTAFRGDYGQSAYTHAVTNKGSAYSSGLYKITTNGEGHVTAASAVQKSDITGLGIPGQDTTYTFDGTYNASTNKAATVSTVTNAIGALDGNLNSTTPGSGKTLTAFSQTDGKVSATFGNISITKSQVSDLGTIGAAAAKGVDSSIAAASTSTNLPTSKAVATFVEGKGYKTTDNNTTYTLTQDSSDGHKITLTPSSGSATTITIPDNNTTYDEATTTVAGLMSAEDKAKLDGVAAGATANVGTITGITMNGSSKGTSGVVNLGTVITAHQDISGKADKTATVSTVSYDSTNKKLTKTINGTTSDIVTTNTLKTAMDLGNVGNFKAVSTVANQGLTATEQANARTNIGAGTSSFSGSYNDLTNKPTLGTAAAKDIASSGNASTTQVVMGNDSRLTDSRNAKDVSAWAKASTKPTYTASEVGAIATSAKGAANGVAELDSSGKIPTSQLPSYVDDVLEYDDFNDFPSEGEEGKIYIAIDTNKTYRWSGTAYTEISASLALGETSSTAYRGDRGKIAYDHASAKGSAFNSGLYKITTNSEGHVTGATTVVKADITGLGIPAQDTTYSAATTSAAGLMSANDKIKLDKLIAYCSTGSSTAAKTAEMTDYTTSNKYIIVCMAKNNSANSKITLNINNTGAKDIYINGQVSSSSNSTLPAGTYIVYDDGTYYHFRTDETIPDINGVVYCNTASNQQIKNAICKGYKLRAGNYFPIIILNDNTYKPNVGNTLLLNINNTGIKTIYINGNPSNQANYTLPAGAYIVYYNDGHYYFNTNGNIPGSVEKVNGHTVETNVPSNAVFTDTTYSNATSSTAGLMSATDKARLDQIWTAFNTYGMLVIDSPKTNPST